MIVDFRVFLSLHLKMAKSARFEAYIPKMCCNVLAVFQEVVLIGLKLRNQQIYDTYNRYLLFQKLSLHIEIGNSRQIVQYNLSLNVFYEIG